MKTCPQTIAAFILLIPMLGGAPLLRAQGTAFTFQGQLQSGTELANGSYDVLFSVWTDATGDSQVGATVTNAATSVANGLFTVTVDVGVGVFDGSPRWLEVAVRTNSGSSFTTLTPRQRISAAPYAIHAGAVAATGISGTIPAANIANGTIAPNMLAAGAAAANLAASGQSAVPSGAMILSPSPDATNLTAAGYTRLGGQLDLAWQPSASALPPAPRGGHTAMWTGARMIVWGGTGTDLKPLGTGGAYDPTLSRWSPVSTNNAPARREGHSAVWTGSEMIVWGGFGGDYLGDGGRYDPASDGWSSVATTNAPAPRRYHTAVWTGTEMIVWGGNGIGDRLLNSGARYSPAAGSWSPVSATGAPTPRMMHTVIWTGTEMVVWGGFLGLNQQAGDGARYNPATDMWSPVRTSNAPAARYEHTAIWTGSEMIVWGGVGNQFATGVSSDGARYNPVTDSWSAISNTGSPSARAAHAAVWTGSEMLVWAGRFSTPPYWWNTGGRYSPADDQWLVVTTSGAPDPRQGHTAVWSGSEMIVFGGYNNDTTFGDLHTYAPSRVMYLYLRP